jgi:hypothetical protein
MEFASSALSLVTGGLTGTTSGPPAQAEVLDWTGTALLVTLVPGIAYWHWRRARQGRPVRDIVAVATIGLVSGIYLVLNTLDSGVLLGDITIGSVGKVPGVVVVALVTLLFTGALYLGVRLDHRRGKE